MLQRSRVPWLGPGVQRTVLLAILVAAVIFGVYHILSSENAHRLSRPEVAGWDDIDECGSLTSFDGTKTIDFERTQKIILTETSSNGDDTSERKVTGTWSFDAEKERYTVSFEGTSLAYQLIKPEDSSVCILTPGDIGAVNLRDSWFGTTEEE
jgi:hypothetical protein